MSSEKPQQEDKTEQPTAKRLREAREKGQVPRSRELANVAVLGAAGVALIALAPAIASGTRGWLRAALTVDPALISQPQLMPGHFARLLGGLFAVASPVILVALAACFISPIVMGGLRFSGQALQPKAERLSPIAGFKRMYGAEALMEFVRALLRVALIGGVAFLVIRSHFDEFLLMPRMSLAEAAGTGTGVIGLALVSIAGALMLLALIDVPWQHMRHRRQLRMTKQEVRDEMKQTEGNPEIKGKVRQLQRQMSQQRMMDAVPDADVVVVNPTHYAVALKYRAGDMSAPVLVAKGVDEIALRIRALARDNGVTIVEAPPLARVLYAQARIDEEIPVKLYTAVAQVLSYVYRLKRWHPAHGPMPVLDEVAVDEGDTGAAR